MTSEYKKHLEFSGSGFINSNRPMIFIRHTGNHFELMIPRNELPKPNRHFDDYYFNLLNITDNEHFKQIQIAS